MFILNVYYVLLWYNMNIDCTLINYNAWFNIIFNLCLSKPNETKIVVCII